MESAGAEGAGCGARDVERTAAGGFGRLDIHEIFLGLGGLGIGYEASFRKKESHLLGRLMNHSDCLSVKVRFSTKNA